MKSAPSLPAGRRHRNGEFKLIISRGLGWGVFQVHGFAFMLVVDMYFLQPVLCPNNLYLIANLLTILHNLILKYIRSISVAIVMN